MRYIIQLQDSHEVTNLLSSDDYLDISEFYDTLYKLYEKQPIRNMILEREFDIIVFKQLSKDSLDYESINKFTVPTTFMNKSVEDEED